MKYIVYVLLCVLAVASTAHAERGSGKEGYKGEDRLRSGIEVEAEDGIVTTKLDDDSSGERRERNKSERSESRMRSLDEARARAIKEIDERIEKLNKLVERIEAMTRVPDATKVAVKATVAAQITSLNDLKTTIQNAADATVLKEQAAKITKASRIYMLVMPQIQIVVAADRIKVAADLLTTVAGKLETRIADAKTAGKDVASLETQLATMKTKIADAKSAADAAVALTANLKPDNGDQAIMDANKKALTDARAKLKTGHENLKTARKSAEAIVKGLKAFGVAAKADLKTEKDDTSKKEDR